MCKANAKWTNIWKSVCYIQSAVGAQRRDGSIKILKGEMILQIFVTKTELIILYRSILHRRLVFPDKTVLWSIKFR